MAGDNIDDISDLEEGQLILFAGKTQPLTVKEVSGDRAIIEGPKGGTYALFEEDDGTLVYSSSGNRRYAYPVEGLRTVGEWVEDDEDHWQHTETGATVTVRKNQIDKWVVEVDGVDLEEPVGYGYMEKKYAMKHAKKILKHNPEG